MSLSAKLSHEFEKQVQERGWLYSLGGTVRVTQGNAHAMQANVRGTELYRIKLDWRKNKLFVSCTCPYYETGGPCKHLWATILVADKKGYLSAAANQPKLRLEMDDDALADSSEDEDEFAEDDFDEDEDELAAGSSMIGAGFTAAGARPQPAQARSAPAANSWKKRLAELSRSMQAHTTQPVNAWPAGREILYLVDVPATLANGSLIVELAFRERKKNGEWSKLKSQRIGLKQIPTMPDPADRLILSLVTGAREVEMWSGYYGGYNYDTTPARCRLSPELQQQLLPLMCATNRCRLRRSPEDEALPELSWDAGGPWEFWLEARRDENQAHIEFAGALRRGDERLALSAPIMLVAGGLVFNHDFAVSRLDDGDAFLWLALLRKEGSIEVPASQADELLTELLRLPQTPRLALPEELEFAEVAVTPLPRLKLKPPAHSSWGKQHLRGELTFAYEGEVIADDDPRRGIYQPDERRLLLRARGVEQAAAARLKQLGFRFSSPYYNEKASWQLSPNNLPRVVRKLVEEKWHVEAEGKLYRQPGAFSVAVKSEIDWFELHGTVEFGDGVTATLPELLAALKRGDNSVRLGDGTFGLLPEEWLKKYGTLAGLGAAQDDHLRFTKSQAGFLDALLAAQPAATFDAGFARVREELKNFSGIEPLDPPATFNGELRGYQREGLGWFDFLQRFSFGGCLADDMGLGKTIMTLALLETRRVERERARAEVLIKGPTSTAEVQSKQDKRSKKAATKSGAEQNNGGAASPASLPRPSLVVVPKSLVFNWEQEAARFAPQLRVLNHTGIERVKGVDHFQAYDLVLTTYGTLRRDAAHLKDAAFDYVILDEAQAVKNAATESAKAVRLLQGRHRLALSGTPIENHLGELWSLFEFLNPGMLGAASVFQLTSGSGGRKLEDETRELLAHALRPFILRRTKDQVAKDLPQKLEQTIYCDMEKEQRRLYDELRDHYRLSLLGRIEREGINKAKIQILEALLRLRQAACHPGLVTKQKLDAPSAKLEVLIPRLGELVEEGHKALVFSQFTSLLSIVRTRLDADGVPYEYLDGRTRKRAEKVERFQTDPDCKLFLISLKAGGLGLNLTAAEYVFLLDPWWNPAVEAQAIDRAHRIGQTQRVFAYRLIARGTVEEKVLELQQSKRQLADAIINADNNLLRSLNREDLELLLA